MSRDECAAAQGRCAECELEAARMAYAAELGATEWPAFIDRVPRCATCPESPASKVCIGFGEREGVCENPAGGPPRDNPIWCGECDTARIAHISAQFKKIEEGFRARA